MTFQKILSVHSKFLMADISYDYRKRSHEIGILRNFDFLGSDDFVRSRTNVSHGLDIRTNEKKDGLFHFRFPLAMASLRMLLPSQCLRYPSEIPLIISTKYGKKIPLRRNFQIPVEVQISVKKVNKISNSSQNQSSSSEEERKPTSEFHRITFADGNSVDVPKGTLLRTAMLKNGVSPHNDKAQIINCRGIGSCGTCAIRVEGQVEPQDWTIAEKLRLNIFPHKEPENEGLRLACQIFVMGDLNVTKMNGFWGQGSEEVSLPVKNSSEVTPFGPVEFLMDRPYKP